jgi:hypothetical protein
MKSSERGVMPLIGECVGVIFRPVKSLAGHQERYFRTSASSPLRRMHIAGKECQCIRWEGSLLKYLLTVQGSLLQGRPSSLFGGRRARC